VKARAATAALAGALALALGATAAPANAEVVSATTDGASAQLNLDGADDVVTVSVENGLLVHDPIGDGLKTGADWDSATPGEQTVAADGNVVVVVNGGDGNDTLSVDAPVDALATVFLNGDGGDDVLTGADTGDNLSGGDGSDVLVGGKGGDDLNGGTGNDTFVWNNGDGSDVNVGGDGNDLSVVNGNPTLGDAFTLAPDQLPGFVRFKRTNLATFSLLSDTERFQINGLGGDDSFSPAPGLGARTGLSIVGGAGADTILGSDGPDRIFGGDGNDTIAPGGGSDVVFGEAGDDQVDLQDGAPDVAHGGDGNDSVLTDGAAVDLVDGFEAVDIPPAQTPPPVVTPPPPVVPPPPAVIMPPAAIQPPAGAPPAVAPPSVVMTATPLTIKGNAVKVIRGRVSIRVSCPATSPGRCTGLLTLRRSGQRLGRAHYDVAPGRKLTLGVKLAATSRRLADRSGHVKVVAVASNRTTRTSHQLTLEFRLSRESSSATRGRRAG
jgi:RTX calcium-binding nonapeptide repeat (4 copies)